MLDDDAFRQSLSVAVGSMWLIEDNPGLTVADVKQQEQLYLGLRETLARRYAALADLATARRFGLEVDPEVAPRLAEYAAGQSVARFPQFDATLRQVSDLSEHHRSFHWELEFPEVFFDKHGYGLGERAGFDIVVGNPPYVRQEQVSAQKPYFTQAYADVYDGGADLYVYFYRRGLELLQAGGRLSYIVTNKWLRAGYGGPLRQYFSQTGHIEQLVDFGHAPIFPDADTFPCILLMRKEPPAAEAVTEVCLFPREEWGKTDLQPYIRRHSYTVPSRRFSRAPWSLERDDVEALIAKVRKAGVPLMEFMGAKPYRGILTGLNTAFLIDTPTRDRLVAEHAGATPLIVAYLRGQDIKRWTPEWAGLWMILLKSSENEAWPWATQGEQAEATFALTYPSLYRHLKPLEEPLRKRQDHGRYWWELRSCSYYPAFGEPKLMYQEIQFHPAFCLDRRGHLCNNKVFLSPTTDLYLLGVLNSPLMWWHNWRYLPHMKDEALNPMGEMMERLPIALPTDTVRTLIESAVAGLLATTEQRGQARAQLLDWLKVEFDIAVPGQKLAAVETLDESAFVAQVRDRRLRTAPRLTPAALHDLKQAYAEHVIPLRSLADRMAITERQVAGWVNEAYGLTPEEVALLWKTAPPRMPGA